MLHRPQPVHLQMILLARAARPSVDIQCCIENFILNSVEELNRKSLMIFIYFSISIISTGILFFH